MTSKYEDAQRSYEKMLQAEQLSIANKKLRNDAPFEQWAKANRETIREALRKAESMDRLIEAREVISQYPYLDGCLHDIALAKLAANETAKYI